MHSIKLKLYMNNQLLYTTMIVLAFDTETTGLTIYDNDRNITSSPYIIQLSFVLFDTDKLEIIHCYDKIIKIDDDVAISSESIAIHGIKREKSKEVGINIVDALLCLFEYSKLATLIVGHNCSFDINMIKQESRRIKECNIYDDNSIWTLPRILSMPTYCTMKELKNICKIPYADSTGYPVGVTSRYKWPKLNELHKHFFGSIPKNLHNSLYDTFVCLRCYIQHVCMKDISKMPLVGDNTTFDLMTNDDLNIPLIFV